MMLIILLSILLITSIFAPRNAKIRSNVKANSGSKDAFAQARKSYSQKATFERFMTSSDKPVFDRLQRKIYGDNQSNNSNKS